MESNNSNRRQWWGPFYVDPKDVRLTVPDRVGIGWTVNLGHRIVRIAAAISILLSLLLGHLTNH